MLKSKIAAWVATIVDNVRSLQQGIPHPLKAKSFGNIAKYRKLWGGRFHQRPPWSSRLLSVNLLQEAYGFILLSFSCFFLLLNIGLLFVSCLIAFVCYFLIVLFSFVICMIYSAKATNCLLFRRTVSASFFHLKFTAYLFVHGAPKQN